MQGGGTAKVVPPPYIVVRVNKKQQHSSKDYVAIHASIKISKKYGSSQSESLIQFGNLNAFQRLKQLKQ